MKLSLLVLLLASFGAVGQPRSASGLDVDAMNKTVEPCVDFYRYACGSWTAAHPLPSDRARWGRFTELSDRNEKVLQDMLQGAAVVSAKRSALDLKIGDATRRAWTRRRLSSVD